MNDFNWLFEEAEVAKKKQKPSKTFEEKVGNATLKILNKVPRFRDLLFREDVWGFIAVFITSAFCGALAGAIFFLIFG